VGLSPQNLAYVIDGLTYVNVHTPINGGGEIRGQILPLPTAIPFTASNRRVRMDSDSDCLL